MGGNAARWMDRLEVRGNAPTTFPEFEKLFLDQYAPLDDKNVARDKLRELRQRNTVQEYITAFDNIVVALPDLAKDDAIHAFIYGLKPRLKGFVKAKPRR